MHIDPSIESTDHKTIAVMVAILAGLVGLIGFAMSDPSVDIAQTQQPVVVAHVATAPSTKTGEAPVKPPEENWSADDSSHGMRPDAAH